MLIATGSVKFPRNVHAKQGIRRECLNRFNGAGGYCGEKNRLSPLFETFLRWASNFEVLMSENSVRCAQRLAFTLPETIGCRAKIPLHSSIFRRIFECDR